MLTSVQGWVAVIGGLVTIILTILRYFGERSRREKASAVGSAFSATVEGLSAQELTKQLAAAVLLRRFFDPSTEQGTAGLPYQREAVAVIAALLRSTPASDLQKLLADGLAYAGTLAGADLQNCNLSHAYWGSRPRVAVTNGTLRMLSRGSGWLRKAGKSDAPPDGDSITIVDADLSYADLSTASLRSVAGARAVFRKCTAIGAVFRDADLSYANFKNAELRGADFRGCNLAGASFVDAKLQRVRFEGARLEGAIFQGAVLDGACFDGASGVTKDIAAVLGSDGVAPASLGPELDIPL
jgi:uncharacterized protein YjbI with pentapeptide repeats